MNEHACECAFESSEALRNDIISEAETLYRTTGLTPSQLQARVAELEAVLRLYRAEVPIGHQPPMAAHHVDELLGLSK